MTVPITVPVPPGAVSVSLVFTVDYANPVVAVYGFSASGPTSVNDGQSVAVPLIALDQYDRPMVLPDSVWQITVDLPGIVSVVVQNSQAIITGLKPGTVVLTSGV